MDEREPIRPRRKLWKTAAITACILAVLLTAVAVLLANGNKVYPNTYIMEEKLSGLEVSQARKRIAALLDGLESSGGITLHLPDGTEAGYISLYRLDAKPETDEGADDTWYCREELGFAANTLHYLSALLGQRTVISVGCTVPQDRLDAAAREMAKALNSNAIDFSCTLREDGTVLLTKPKNGLRVDSAALSETLREALAAPLQSDAELPCRILYAQQGDLAAARESIVGEVRNAAYDKENACITPSRIGVDISQEKLRETYDALEEGQSCEPKVTVTPPTVTTEALEEGLFRDELSSYTTKVGGAAGRHENVRITAERVNGTILNAGESIRYAELVTPFTAENGYFPAPGYVQGKTVDLIGGGVCQTSSTLYAASLYANLEIVQRRNHGFASDYIGLGLDATVAEGGPEFEMRNNTDYPIRIDAVFERKFGKDYVTVSIYGTKTDDTYVKITSEVISTTPFKEEIIETDELKPGERVVEQTAYTGYVVKTYRNIYSGDGRLLQSIPEATSRYNARDRIVKVGKAAVETAASVSETQPVTTTGETASQESAASAEEIPAPSAETQSTEQPETQPEEKPTEQPETQPEEKPTEQPETPAGETAEQSDL